MLLNLTTQVNWTNFFWNPETTKSHSKSEIGKPDQSFNLKILNLRFKPSEKEISSLRSFHWQIENFKIYHQFYIKSTRNQRGENISQCILWDQYYPTSNIRKRWYPKKKKKAKNYKLISHMNIDAKNFCKILANWIQ